MRAKGECSELFLSIIRKYESERKEHHVFDKQYTLRERETKNRQVFKKRRAAELFVEFMVPFRRLRPFHLPRMRSLERCWPLLPHPTTVRSVGARCSARESCAGTHHGGRLARTLRGEQHLHEERRKLVDSASEQAGRQTIFAFLQTLHDQFDTFVRCLVAGAILLVGQVVHRFDDLRHVLAIDRSVFVLI